MDYMNLIELKGDKDRVVPFPHSFKELLAMHADFLTSSINTGATTTALGSLSNWLSCVTPEGLYH